MESRAEPDVSERAFDVELAGAAQQFTHAIMAKERSAVTLTALVSAVRGLAASAMVANRRIVPDTRAIACKAGCNYCCDLLVTVTAPEVLTVLQHILDKFDPAELRALKERVQSADDVTHGMNGHDRHYAKLSCPLLIDGKCSVYGARPLVCHGYTSYSWLACADSLRHPRTTKYTPVDWGRRSTYGGTQDGMITALSELGFEKRPLELIAAMRIALEEPDVTERWLGGEPVFANAEEASEVSVVKRSIEGRMYDTSHAEEVAKYAFGKPGDPYYREETLYRSRTSGFFLGGIGAENSYYAHLVGNRLIPGEDIIELRDDEARRWLEDQGHTDVIEGIFGSGSASDNTTVVGVRLPEELKWRAEHAAAKVAVNVEQWIEQLVRHELARGNED